MKLLNILGQSNWVSLNKPFVAAIGIEEAYLFTYLLDRYEYFYVREELDNENMFYATVEDVENYTGFGEKVQRSCINKLKDLGILATKIKGLPNGLPATRHFFFPADAEQKLCKIIETQKSKSLKSERNIKRQNGGIKNSQTQELETPFGQNKKRHLGGHNNTIIDKEQTIQKTNNQEGKRKDAQPQKKIQVALETNNQPDYQHETEKEKKVAAKKEKETTTFFQDQCQARNLHHLAKFEIQITDKQFNELAAKNSEAFVWRVLEKINAYCTKNPRYTSNRTSLPLIFAQFAKTTYIDQQEQCLETLKTWFFERFGVQMVQTTNDTKNWLEIAEKISQMANGGDVENLCRAFLDKLPVKWAAVGNFNLNFINKDFQQIVLLIQAQQNGTATNQNKGNRITADLLKTALNNL